MKGYSKQFANKIKRLAPPGYETGKEIISYVYMMFLIFLYSLIVFCSRLNRGLDSLYTYQYGIKVLDKYAVMPQLSEIMRNSLIAIWGLVACAVLSAADHYRSYRKDSKSIYVMKRLEDRTLIHKQSLTLPLIAVAAGIIFCAMLALAYRHRYFSQVPPQCLPEQTPLDIWRLIL